MRIDISAQDLADMSDGAFSKLTERLSALRTRGLLGDGSVDAALLDGYQVVRQIEETHRINRIDAEIKTANQGVECVYDRVL